MGTSDGLDRTKGSRHAQAAQGYRLHTISTSAVKSTGLGGDRIRATMVFEKLS